MRRCWRRIMIILLVLLPALFLSEEVPKIDLTKCLPDTESRCQCFKSEQGLLLERYEYDSRHYPNPEKCKKIGLQNKFFNDLRALFQIQVTLEEGEHLVDGSAVEVYQGTSLMFGCKLENGQVKLVENADNKDLVQNYKISLFEDRSFMKNKNVFCAIQSTNVKNLVNLIKTRGQTRFRNKTNVKLNWNNKVYTNDQTNEEFFIGGYERNIKCDPYSFKDLSTSKEYVVHPLKNRDADVLNCDNYNVNKNLFTLRYQKIDHPDENFEIKQLKCIEKNDDFYYVPGKTDSADETKIVDMEEITEPDSYYFYCAAHIDELCESPIRGCTDTETTTCPEYIPGEKVKLREKRKPATLTCPSGKWLINKQYYDLEVSCMKNFMGDSNTAIFFAKLPSGRKIPVPEDARCARSVPVYDCRLKSKLELPKEETNANGGLVDDSNGMLKCKNPDRILTIYNPEKDETINKNPSYSCNPLTGAWMSMLGYNDRKYWALCKEQIAQNLHSPHHKY